MTKQITVTLSSDTADSEERLVEKFRQFLESAEETCYDSLEMPERDEIVVDIAIHVQHSVDELGTVEYVLEAYTE